MSRLLTEAQINGKGVAFFAPPHPEPDFPWVDTLQLARAFLPKAAAIHMLKTTQRYEDGKTVKTIRDGGRLTTIMCHHMAQGLCGGIDEVKGHPGEDGPAYTAYCTVAGQVSLEHWPMSVPDMIAAFKNCGGPFARS